MSRTSPASRSLLTASFFSRSTLDVAPDLIGSILRVGRVTGRIVEVEAYTDDYASHGATRTARSNIMHDTYGMVYIYFIYGMYYCLNFTTDRRDVGAVLVRAVEPLDGIELMVQRRGVTKLNALCNGPGKLCRAFAIDEDMNWTLVGDTVKLYHGECGEISSGTRIGITKAAELHWRFFEKNNPFVSRP